MIIAMQEKLGLTRKKTVSLVLLLIFIIGNLPCIMAYGPWRDVKILNKNIFDIFDVISSNILFILTAFGTAIFAGWILGDKAKEKLGNGFKNKIFINIWFNYVKFILPLIIAIIFISGIGKVFGQIFLGTKCLKTKISSSYQSHI